MQDRRDRRIEGRNLMDERDNDRDLLIEPQQGLDVTVIQVGMGAADRGQAKSGNIERPCRGAEVGVQERIGQDRRASGLYQNGGVPHKSNTRADRRMPETVRLDLTPLKEALRIQLSK